MVSSNKQNPSPVNLDDRPSVKMIGLQAVTDFLQTAAQKQDQYQA
jgi:hypothetical protein